MIISDDKHSVSLTNTDKVSLSDDKHSVSLTNTDKVSLSDDKHSVSLTECLSSDNKKVQRSTFPFLRTKYQNVVL